MGNLGTGSTQLLGRGSGKLKDQFVGAKSAEEVSAFVSRLAALAGPAPGAADDASAVAADARAAAFQLLTSGDVPGAAALFQAEYSRLRDEDEAAKQAARDDPAAPRRKGLSKPLEYDDERPGALDMGWCLYGLARCAMENDPPEADAAAQLLGALEDERRKSVLDKNVDFKAAVSQLSLALAPEPDDNELGDARRAFASGDLDTALDLGLKCVRRAGDADAKEAARALVVQFIDAMGPGPESTRARKRLANVLF